MSPRLIPPSRTDRQSLFCAWTAELVEARVVSTPPQRRSPASAAIARTAPVQNTSDHFIRSALTSATLDDNAATSDRYRRHLGRRRQQRCQRPRGSPRSDRERAADLSTVVRKRIWPEAQIATQGFCSRRRIAGDRRLRADLHLCHQRRLGLLVATCVRADTISACSSWRWRAPICQLVRHVSTTPLSRKATSKADIRPRERC